MEADCDGGIARVLCFARVFGAAEPFWAKAHRRVVSIEGLEIHTKFAELGLSEVLRELDKESEHRLILLKESIEFAEQHQTTARLEWWKERAMTLLAEDYYQLGNRAEADRLFAEVRGRLPEKTKHDIAGWCKSWCDRHEARQLMEKGDWDGAYSKIVQARVGTIDYGHRNLSKGLTMERILRMSAEIQQKRGELDEAREDLEYAQLIADHAAKLRIAVEAEMEKFRESEKNGAVAPAR